MVLKLKKSLYGLKQSPRNHFNNLSSKRKTLGFKSCDAVPCLFISEKCICLVYVDDTLMFAQTQSDIESIVKGLKNLGMDLEEEDSVAGFLGVLIQRHSDNSPTIELLQTGLIQRIADALQISHLPPKRTPAKVGVLGSDPEGDAPSCTFNYASVIGMMGYLQSNSRPDITFATVRSFYQFSSQKSRAKLFWVVYVVWKRLKDPNLLSLDNIVKQLHPLGLICLGPLILGKNTCRSEVILLDQFMDEDSSQTEWNRFRRLRERSVRLITCWSSGRQFGLASTHCMS
jgi:hypothetical protein